MNEWPRSNGSESSQGNLEKTPKQKAAEWINNSIQKKDDRYVFVDPSTQEPLGVDVPPEFLQNDTELAAGYQFLNEFGNRLDMQILYGRHYFAEDLGPPGNFEAKLDESDILLLERIGWTEEHAREISHLSQTGQLSQAAYSALVGTGFDKRIFGSLSGSQKAAGFYDINSKQEDELRVTLNSVTDLLIEIVRNQPDTQDTRRAKIIQWGAFENTRDWFMVGQLGHEVARLCQDNPELLHKLASGQIKILVPVGSAHRNFGERLARYIPNFKEVVLKDVGEGSDDEFIRNSIRQGFIDVSALDQQITT